MIAMAVPKRYFHDRSVLILLTLNVFLTLLAAVWIMLRLSAGHGTYITRFRPSLGISAYQPGGVIDLLSFIVFVFLVCGIHLFLSMRMYHIHRQLAVVILALGILLLVLAIVVSNALLVLR